MNGWGSINEWVTGWIGRWIDGWMGVWVDERMGGRMNWWLDGCEFKDGWLVGGMTGRMVG